MLAGPIHPVGALKENIGNKVNDLKTTLGEKRAARSDCPRQLRERRSGLVQGNRWISAMDRPSWG
jgi:hypothetical protein